MVSQGSEIIECLVGHSHGYGSHVIARYYAALVLRRFVILAGPPGVGKIGLARGLAEALAGRPDEQWCLFQAHKRAQTIERVEDLTPSGLIKLIVARNAPIPVPLD